MEESKDKDKKAILTIILIVIVSIIFAAITGNYIVELSLIKRTSGNDKLNIVFSSSDSSYKTNSVKGYPGKYTKGNAVIKNNGDPTISGLNAHFTEPGQSVTYSLYIMNLSPYNAFLDEIMYGTLDSNGKFKLCTSKNTKNAQDVCDSISVIVSVGDGLNNVTVEESKYIQGHTLNKSIVEPINITIYYDINGEVALEPTDIQFADIYLKFRQL